MSKRSKRRKRKPRSSGNQIAKRNEQNPTSISLSKTEIYSGPLPSPETLSQFEDIVPGAATRIFDVFEMQATHRMELERNVIASDIRRSYLGLGLGFVVSMTALIGGCWVAVNGHPGAGGTIATASVAALAGVFVYGSQIRKQERSDRK